MMSQLKKFAMVLVGVIFSLVVIALIPASIRANIPGLRAIQ